ncbi:hypothetical protein BD779DRAFT_1607228 [Infundibulicybe gibba]|nr:hypothetical protein BD779DRAFT_1607228 [Infundibulicybe gibba]
MHDVVTNPSATTKGFTHTTSDELLPPISLSTQQQPADSLFWSPTSESQAPIDNWNISTPSDTPPAHQLLLRCYHKLPLSSNMPSRIDGEVSADADDVHGAVRTPPKSKQRGSVVPTYEASPLETSSSASVDSSPHQSDHQISISHSRGSSTDTTVSSSHESSGSAAGDTLLAHPGHKVGNVIEVRERPHSFSGGLSSADLRRLQQIQQQQQWHNQFRDGSDQPPIHRSQTPQPHPQLYDYRPTANTQPLANRDELQIDYNIQQRNFNPLPQGLPLICLPRPPNNSPTAYRPQPRGFPQPTIQTSPTTVGYPPSHHTSHLSLGNTQQLYEMMLPGVHDSHHPAVTRVQQQHNVFRATHHHSASDPSNIRDAATLALINNNLQAFASGIFQPGLPPPGAGMSLYPNQFYGAPDGYPRPDVATVQAMAARLQSQYPGPNGMDGSVSSPTSTTGQNGPSANNRKLGLYKTELCRSWEEKGTCRYGTKCQFAHGEEELRKVARHPKTFWVSGSCPYGKRCCFIHTELPTSGAPGATSTADNTPHLSHDQMLRQWVPFYTPATGSLRVDTSALDGPSVKQNKSAYPTFASNGILLPAPEHISAKSPAPHNNSRLEIVGYNNRSNKSNVSNSNVRHSFNGTEDINFSPAPPIPAHSSFALSPNENSNPPAVPAGDIIGNSPWSTTELTMGPSRLNDKAWA